MMSGFCKDCESYIPCSGYCQKRKLGIDDPDKTMCGFWFRRFDKLPEDVSRSVQYCSKCINRPLGFFVGCDHYMPGNDVMCTNFKEIPKPEAVMKEKSPIFDVETKLDFEPFCKNCTSMETRFSEMVIPKGWLVRITCENIHKCRHIYTQLKKDPQG